jgi:hypothetical protein
LVLPMRMDPWLRYFYGIVILSIAVCGCFAILVMAEVQRNRERDLERRIEQEFAYIDFRYNYSEHQWCVDAQRRNAKPGVFVGGCWRTRHEADEGILSK